MKRDNKSLMAAEVVRAVMKSIGAVDIYRTDTRVHCCRAVIDSNLVFRDLRRHLDHATRRRIACSRSTSSTNYLGAATGVC